MSNLLPSEITRTGVLKNGIWIAGVVVRIRDRDPVSSANTKGKGKSKVAKKGKIDKPHKGLELHLNAGTSSAEVIMVQSWHAETTTRLRKIAQIGTSMRFTGVNIRAHNESSSF